MAAFGTILAAWIAADLLHSLWILFRRRRWERVDGRGSDGLRPGSHGFSEGGGPLAVLVIPGFADIPAAFLPMARQLAAGGGLHVQVLRLPGAGETPEAAGRHTLEDWLAAITRAAAQLRASHRRVWLLGHSMGAGLALLAGRDCAGLADGVVALAPLLEVSTRRSPVLKPRIWFRLAEVVFVFSRVFESCFSTDVTLPDGSFHYRRDRFIPFATYRNLFRLVDRLHADERPLHLPLHALLVAGDPVVDTPAAEAWMRARAAGCLDLRTVPGREHAVHTSEGWKEVTSSIRSFILAHS